MQETDDTDDDTNQLIATDYEQNWQDDEQYVYDDNGNREEVTYDANPPLDYTVGDNNLQNNES